MSEDATLGRKQILTLLEELSKRATGRGVRVEMFLVGGAAMVLVYNTKRTTKDVEGIFEPKMVAYEIAAEIARDSDLGLAPDWLNDAVKIFPFPGDRVDEEARIFYDSPGLNLRIASPRYLFAMKAWSGRESDEDDLRALWPLCQYANAEECLAYIESAYPPATLKPRTQYLVEAIAANASLGQAVRDRGRNSEIDSTPGASPGGVPSPRAGAVWVQPHQRDGHYVQGYWRNRR